MAPPQVQKLFDRYDTDQNGTLSFEEFKKCGAMIAAASAGGAGGGPHGGGDGSSPAGQMTASPNHTVTGRNISNPEAVPRKMGTL